MAIEMVSLELIQDNPYQSRQVYHKKDIDELAASIKAHGLLQVPLARRKDGDRVELAFGQLRKRAFMKLAKEDPEKWGKMPLDIHEFRDEEMAVFSLEENLKRHDITPIEVARAVEKFLEGFPDITEEQLAKQLAMTQGNISHMRRVLRLPEQILEKINEGKINFTMGRELLVFQDLANGKDLMLEAIRGIKTENRAYGHPNTVEGLQKCIHDVARNQLRALEKGTTWYRADPLFDTRAAGCLQCQHMIRTHPTKSDVAHWCINQECWDRKQQEHKDLMAAEAKAKMTADVLQKVAVVEEKRQQDITQVIIEAGSEVFVDKEKLKQVKDSSSGDRISEGQPVRRPFTLGDKLYICTGDTSKGKDWSTTRSEAYQLMPKGEFSGAPRTYLMPPDREDEEYYESLRNDPMGFYHGMLVKRGGTEHVLVGPPIIISLESVPKDIEVTEGVVAADEEERARIEQVKRLEPEHPCHGCLNIKRCDRTTVVAGEGGTLTCAYRLTKETAQELRQRATVEIPPELEVLAREKAGTRAEVLDLRELRLGGYGWQLKQGYSSLGSELNRIADPSECLERCTQGFHYAFDSDRNTGEAEYVCSNPKCLSQKKSAFTRAKNAAGQAKKKAEAAAIKRAIQETGAIDRPRMKLIILAQMQGRHIGSVWGDKSPRVWLSEKVGMEKPGTVRWSDDSMIEALDKLSDEEMAKLVVEFMLEMLRYRGEVENYRIETTEALNWMGIGVSHFEPL